MGRPTTKAELLEAAECGFTELNEIIASLTEKELETPFDFSEDEKKKEAHWKRDKNLRDILIHLYEWHQLNLNWVEANKEGRNVPFLPKPYTWRMLGEMNQFFWQKHQNTSLEEAMEMLAQSHRDIMALAEKFSNEELFSKGVFSWAGTSTVGSYFAANTSSHYNWAMKKLKAHRKNVKNRTASEVSGAEHDRRGF